MYCMSSHAINSHNFRQCSFIQSKLYLNSTYQESILLNLIGLTSQYYYEDCHINQSSKFSIEAGYRNLPQYFYVLFQLYLFKFFTLNNSCCSVHSCKREAYRSELHVFSILQTHYYKRSNNTLAISVSNLRQTNPGSCWNIWWTRMWVCEWVATDLDFLGIVVHYF